MKVVPTGLPGCFIIERVVHTDHRGTFTESYNKKQFEDSLGVELNFVQDNVSYSAKNVLRGLHFQYGNHAQAKLLTVLKGTIKDVVLDIRTDSRTFGEHVCIELSASNRKSLFIPKGMAHGFLSLEDDTILSYKCDSYYHPSAEGGVYFNDPDLGIPWGIGPDSLELSERDRHWPRLKDLKQ